CPAADRSSWRLRRRDQAPVPCLRDMRSLVAACLRRHVALRDRVEHLDAESFQETGAALLGVWRDPLFLAICALLTLWSFNPVWGSVLYLHMTEGLGFSEQSFGNVTSAFFAGSLIGSIGYGIYCRSVRLSTLLHLSILAAIVSNGIYWQ